ncbi:MAG TPA: hypothetical protein VKR56_09675 [Candidatus Cybelea sp.]|nr:hypothetical protein [Candidatus Cybelea sp.]
MPSSNGESAMPHAPLELKEVLNIETNEGASLPFEVVGILEDPQENVSYAVLLHEPENGGEEQFIVTDLAGNLLEDDALAQEILDDFLTYVHEGDEAGTADEERG